MRAHSSKSPVDLTSAELAFADHVCKNFHLSIPQNLMIHSQILNSCEQSNIVLNIIVGEPLFFAHFTNGSIENSPTPT
jgi:hypothetical protein